jgi:hypothetical protein
MGVGDAPCGIGAGCRFYHLREWRKPRPLTGDDPELGIGKLYPRADYRVVVSEEIRLAAVLVAVVAVGRLWWWR